MSLNLKTMDYVCVESPNDFHREFDTVAEVLQGSNAVMAVNIADRQADYNTGNTQIRQMDRRAIGGTAAAYGFLYGDPQLLCQIKGITLEAGVCDHACINVAQHGAFVYGGL